MGQSWLKPVDQRQLKADSGIVVAGARHVTSGWAAFSLLLASCACCYAQLPPSAAGTAASRQSPAPNTLPRHPLASRAHPAAMPIDAWSSLSPDPVAAPQTRAVDTRLPSTTAEEITVLGRNRHQDQDWRADLRAGDTVYEASNSDSAQPLVPFPAWTSPEQQRLMSDKTEFLGLCGALGGYIQCPNKAP